MAPSVPSLSEAIVRRRKYLSVALGIHISLINCILYLMRSRSSTSRARLYESALSTMGLLSSAAGSFLHSPWHRSVWSFPRTNSWFYNYVLELYDERMWIADFRMTKKTLFDLAGKLRPYLLRKDTVMRSAVPVEERVAIGVYYLSSKTCFRTLGNIFGRGKSTIGSIVVEFCLCIEHVLLRKVVRPTDFSKMTATFRKHGMVNCVGAVDGTHISICCPKLQAIQYFNRKSFHSVVLQAACDGDGIFFSMLTGHSGVNHDAYVFRSSRLYERMESGSLIPGARNFNYDGTIIPPIILGDAAYPLRKWLMKPFPVPATDIERNYNKIFNRSRNVVERAFGRLKARFRRLAVRIESKIENVNSIVAASVILHNICERNKHEIPDESTGTVTGNQDIIEHSDTQCSVSSNFDDRRDGERVRRAISNYLFYHSPVTT